MQSVEVNVSVDLFDVGGGLVGLPGKVLYDQNDLPVEVEINLRSAEQDILKKVLSGQANDTLRGKSVILRPVESPEIRTKIKFVSSTNVNSGGEVLVRCHLGQANSGAGKEPVADGTWAFRLTNVKLYISDHATKTPPPPGVPEHLYNWKLDKVVFDADGREWELKDEMFGQWEKQRPRDVHVPLVTATLSTVIQEGDTLDSISETADTITLLLTFALARSVRAVKIEQLDIDGNVLQWSTRNLMVYAFRQGGFAPVDNCRSDVLRQFLETAYPIVAADREWWWRTLNIYMQVHVNPYGEVKGMILNVLAERFATKLRVVTGSAEIDASLGDRIDAHGFKTALHKLLGELSDDWTQDHTNSLIETIKGWNSRPSFTKAIRRACEVVGVKPPHGKVLATRHRLLHAGELHPPDMTPRDYWLELDAVVLLLILRMLGYDGWMYHPKLGKDVVMLREYLVPSSTDSQ